MDSTVHNPYHTIYEKNALITARVMALQNNEELLIAIHKPSGVVVLKQSVRDVSTLEPLKRYINDEMHYAELEFALGALGELEIVRGPGEPVPMVLQSKNMMQKRTY